MKKTMQSVRMALILMVVCGLLFPLSLIGISNILFPKQAQGSLIYNHDRVVGSTLIAQDFKDPQYLSGRPYLDQDGVSGSNNWAVGSPAYQAELERRIEAFIVSNPGVDVAEIPLELITESGSSLDPHISLQGALVQVDRMVSLNRLDRDHIVSIIKNHTDRFDKVNVLKVNLEIFKALN